MPKYNVTVSHTVTTVYDTVEIEADDEAAAKTIAEEMVEDGELAEDNSVDAYDTKAEEIV